MSKFKRVSLAGSEELFRPTRPKVLDDTDDVISEAVDRPPAHVEEAPLHRLALTESELQLLLEAIQAAKYPEQKRTKPSLDKFHRFDALREKLQG